jgi:hypothetical protein
MELNITELEEHLFEDDDDYDDDDENDIAFKPASFEKIPENTFPVKVVKKRLSTVKFNAKTRVKFQEPLNQINQINKQIPKQYAKMTRQPAPLPKSTLSYDDILSKMGMCVYDGKLHLMGNVDQEQDQAHAQMQPQQQIKKQRQMQPQNNIPQNNYIYNKYFKDQMSESPNVNKPMNAIEYKNMLIRDIMQKYKIRQMKSTKLIMPTSNINFARSSSNLNKLFDFSKR